jgi:hypothetical protein
MGKGMIYTGKGINRTVVKNTIMGWWDDFNQLLVARLKPQGPNKTDQCQPSTPERYCICPDWPDGSVLAVVLVFQPGGIHRNPAGWLVREMERTLFVSLSVSEKREKEKEEEPRLSAYRPSRQPYGSLGPSASGRNSAASSHLQFVIE